MNRKEAIKVLNELKQGIFPADMDIIIDALCLSVNALEEERPHGEWIEHRQFISMGYFVSEYECSNCHDDVMQKTEWQFCPNCGADMREGEEE